MAFSYGSSGGTSRYKAQSSSYRPPASTGQQQQKAQVQTPTQPTNYADNLKYVAKKPDLKTVDDSVGRMRQQLDTNERPKAPEPIDLRDYSTNLVTIDELAKKYGFDYSREYAEQQAETVAQAKRDEIRTQRERNEYESSAAQENLEHEYFQENRLQEQHLADAGMNAGIAAESNFQLSRQMQDDKSEILAQEQLTNIDLDRQLGTVSREEQQRIEEIYHRRRQQGFQNAMDYSRFNQSESQWRANMAMQQREQLSNEAWREFEFNNMSASQREQFLQKEKQIGYENAWREFEFNNMSASERANFVANAERYGLNQAWERHKFDAQNAYDLANARAGASATGGNWRTTKGEPPQSFKNHLTSALNQTNYPSSWIPAMSELIARESTWSPTAKNPNSSAHGYGQFLTQTRQNYERKHGIKYSTPVNQLVLTMHYVKDRYGTPQKAIEFHNKNNWY